MEMLIFAHSRDFESPESASDLKMRGWTAIAPHRKTPISLSATVAHAEPFGPMDV